MDVANAIAADPCSVQLRGVGLGAGLGHELIQRGAIAIDASVHVGASIFGGGGMAALGLGLTWN